MLIASVRINSARYVFDTRHRHRFNGYIIVERENIHWCHTCVIQWTSCSRQSRRLAAVWPLTHNRLTVNRSGRIKIISLSANGLASASVGQRDRISDSVGPSNKFYSARHGRARRDDENARDVFIASRFSLVPDGRTD